jgi:lactoylglutathione lyase
MKINLIVIKTSQPDFLAEQYELIGLNFEYHKHSNGPYHYATSIEGLTFEIYPLPKSKTESDNTTRLGFEIEKLDTVIRNLTNTNWKIISMPELTEWGYNAILEDIDGRKIELKEK